MANATVLDVDPDGYGRNRLHNADVPWQETNCYADIWIELIHVLGFEVEPCLAFTLAADFEQDQWTFFRPPPEDLRTLYGIELEELALWRALPEQCQTQITAGCLPLMEVDAFYLPDTAATDYRTNHTKTTIAINEINLEKKLLGYFHNTGYYHLQKADYDGLFRLDRETPPDYLAPYCEIVKLDRLRQTDPAVEEVLALLQHHADRRPLENPFTQFAISFSTHLGWIQEGGMRTYDAYVFTNLRQCGAAFELAARLLQWLQDNTGTDWQQPAQPFRRISSLCKQLLLKLARVASGKAPGDFSGQLQEMAVCWQRGFEALDGRLAQR